MTRTGWRPATVGLAMLAGLLAMLAGLLAGCAEPEAPAATDPPAGGFLLRATVTQALPPEEVFGWMPAVAILDDRTLISARPVPAIFPGPLVPNLRGRTISRAGYDRIVATARELGLLDEVDDFSPPDLAPGSQLGRLELVVDGAPREIVGDPSRVIQCVRQPCAPPPGTPEAFGTFWQQLTALPTGLEDEVGPEFGYRPDGYAVLVGLQPPDAGGLQPNIADWPLGSPLAEAGVPIGEDPLPRCATFEGEEALTLEPVFGQANQLTRWSDGGAADDALSIAVRPLLPGEDVCRELFGIGE